MIIIGLGSGRCGTKSLASLLNAQPDTVCFHEVNPSCMAWTGTERTVLSMLEEFRAVLAGGPRQITVDLATRRRAEQLPRLRSLQVVRAIGDVASYYLTYAPMLAEMPDVRMPVLRRDKAATIASFVEVMRIRRSPIRTVIDGVATLVRRRPYRRFRNHWVQHDGRRWRRSVKFDKCFPKFQADTLEDALGQYWDLYYRTAGELAARYPDKIRIFEVEDLNTQSGQRAILEFCGLRQPVYRAVRANVKGRTSDPMLAAAPPLPEARHLGGWIMTSQNIEHHLAPALQAGIDAARRPNDQARGMQYPPATSRHDNSGVASAAAAGANKDPAAMAKVVLCICTCKRPVSLERLLEAAAELDFDGQLSVVVVDNDAAGAAEGLGVCARLAAAGYRWPLVCAPEERRGISFARNRAVALALEQDPDFIAALDDDERPSRGWLREMLRVQAETGADAVGGPKLPDFALDAPAWLVEGRFFGRGISCPDKAEVRLNDCGNFMARASCFRALMPEPFDTRFALTGGEGGIFFRRLVAQNCTMRWAARAVIHESVPPSRATLRWLMQRRFRLGVNMARRQRVLQPGLGRELYFMTLTMGQLGAGLMFFLLNFRQPIPRTRAMLTICKALGRAAGQFGARYAEYRRIHGA